ncbi:MAG: flagellar hook-basal body complex protein FliE [Magnetospirillum sp. WYHS-4]
MSGPTTSFNDAVSAYGRIAKIAGGAKPAASVGGGGEDDFAGLVKSAIQEAVRINRDGEKLSIKALQDKADLSQVVSAVAEAELTLQTFVAVRDKVVEAYKEILRMPV